MRDEPRTNARSRETRVRKERRGIGPAAKAKLNVITHTMAGDNSLKAERPEARRRLKLIVEGRHPDSGKPLKPGEEATLRPGERVALQMWACLASRVPPTIEVGNLIEAYGWALNEEPRFLSAPNIQISSREFLARIAPAAAALGGFNAYDLAIVELMRERGRYVLQGLARRYSGDIRFLGPAFGWWAILMAFTLCLPVPVWVKSYLAEASAKIMEGAQPSPHKTYRKDAERVGVLLGFGNRGRGQPAVFKIMNNLVRDIAIYQRVVAELADGEKLDIAYDNVRKQFGVSRSTVVRAYQSGVRAERERKGNDSS